MHQVLIVRPSGTIGSPRSRMSVMNIITFCPSHWTSKSLSRPGAFNHFNHIGRWNCDWEILAVMNHDRQRGRFHAISLSM